MANRTIRTAKRARRFLEVLGKTGNVTLAARAIKAGRTAVYAWRDEDDVFKAAWDEQLDAYADLLEFEADRRARHGVMKPIYYKGAMVGREREYSDTLLMFRLRALKPETYREKQDHKHTFTGPLVVENVNYADASTDPV